MNKVKEKVLRKHDIEKEDQELLELKRLSSIKKMVNKEFQNILEASDKYFNAEYVHAQGKEIINYLYKLRLTPLRAWESFILEAINRNKDVFMHDFYLKENEYGQLELDVERIKTLVLDDIVEEDTEKSGKPNKKKAGE
jgi:hypothetical protein